MGGAEGARQVPQGARRAGAGLRGLILASGLGSRLSPFSDRLPKALAPVGERPVIWYVLQRMAEAGVIDVGITVAGTDSPLARWWAHDPVPGVRVTWLEETERTGTGGALRDHADFMGDEPGLVLPADILSSVDLAALVRTHEQDPHLVTIAFADQDPSSWWGDVAVPRGDSTFEYLFKPRETGRGESTCLGSTGAWVVEPEAVEQFVPDHGSCDFSEDVLPRVSSVPRGLGVHRAGCCYHRDVGNPAWLYAANLELAQGEWGAQYRTDDGGDVLVSPHAEVAESAVLFGPNVVGPGVRVEDGSWLSCAVLLPGWVCPAGTRIHGGLCGLDEALTDWFLIG